MSSNSPKRRAILRTVLIVGEGACEVAFLNHLKTLFVKRGCGVTVKISNAKGKGSAHVVDFALKQSQNSAYDDVAALLDTDDVWTDALKKHAKKNKIKLVPSEPCVEGLLLEILDEFKMDSSQHLKAKMHLKLSRKETEATSYATLFTVELLEERKTKVASLNTLIQLMQGTNNP